MYAVVSPAAVYESPGVLSGRSGMADGAFVERVICGMVITEEVAVSGRAVPVVSPAVGTTNASSVSGSFVPAASEGGVSVGIVKYESVSGIRVRLGTGSSRTPGVQWIS